jgi:glycosyltransferase involved in cell wall biosynthesis
MDILFIHNNFPGQFKHLAPALAAQGHRVLALTPRVDGVKKWEGVTVVPYQIKAPKAQQVHSWLLDMDTKLHRAEGAYRAAADLKKQGFNPVAVIAHPGWGESLFMKDVWPDARLGLFCELYYQSVDGGMNFDPEFPVREVATEPLRIRMKNLNNRLHHEIMDAGICPTKFQLSSYPDSLKSKITISHDGIDTNNVRPNPEARLEIAGLSLTKKDEVITFVNRNLEPYRGYHIFMRALPELLKRRPNATVLIVGGDGVSYGAAAPRGQTWKQIFIDEVRDQISDEDWARVHFLGKIPYDKFLTMLQVTSAHVYLTYPFVLSWSMIEAMASEAPIVANDVAPVTEVLVDGQNGLLVDFFDKDGLVDRVCTVLDDKELAARMGKAARELAVSKYDLKSVCMPNQLNWIENLIARPRIDPQD